MEYISAEGFEKIKEELRERKTIKRQEIAKRLEEAKSLGDLSENTEYTEAKEAQAFNEGKILELEEIVKKATLVKPGRRGGKTIQVGSVVEVRIINSNKGNSKQFFTIVGSHETDPAQGKISNESPLGQAFFDHRVGDIIEVETPRGKVKYKIVGIK